MSSFAAKLATGVGTLATIAFAATTAQADVCDFETTKTVEVAPKSWPSIAGNLQSDTHYIFAAGSYTPGIDVVSVERVRFTSKGAVAIAAPAAGTNGLAAVWIEHSADIEFSGISWGIDGQNTGAGHGLAAKEIAGCLGLDHVVAQNHPLGHGIQLSDVQDATVQAYLGKNNWRGLSAKHTATLRVLDSNFANNDKAGIYDENGGTLDVSNSAFGGSQVGIYTLWVNEVYLSDSNVILTVVQILHAAELLATDNQFTNATLSLNNVTQATIRSRFTGPGSPFLSFGIAIIDSGTVSVTDALFEDLSTAISATGTTNLLVRESSFRDVSDTAIVTNDQAEVSVENTFFSGIGQRAMTLAASDSITVRNNIITRVGRWWAVDDTRDPLARCKMALHLGYRALHVDAGSNAIVRVGHNTFEHIGGFASYYGATGSQNVQVRNNLSASVCSVIRSLSPISVGRDAYFKSIYAPYAGVNPHAIHADPKFCGATPFLSPLDARMDGSSSLAEAGAGTAPSSITPADDFGGIARPYNNFAVGAQNPVSCSKTKR